MTSETNNRTLEDIPDSRERAVLNDVKTIYTRLLGDNLVGIYVHGSTVLGSFHWERSDIDFLVVVKEALSFETKQQLMKELVFLHKHANPHGLEMSIVLLPYCREPSFPTPFDLHFSSGALDWYEQEPEQYCRNMVGMDHDLGTYFAVIKQSGIVLCGEPIDKVFGELPESVYLQSVIYDLKDAADDYMENPVYHTLNLCRTLAYFDDGVIRSKQGGGEWGLEKLPKEFKSLILAALDYYRDGIKTPMDGKKAEHFRDFAFELIMKKTERK